MHPAFKITFGILILVVVVLRRMRGDFRGARRMVNFVFLGFAGVYLIFAGILDLLGKA